MQGGDQKCTDVFTWGSCSKRAGLTREWLPQVAPSQLLATSGRHSMQEHTDCPRQLDSAIHRLPELDALELCILAFSTNMLLQLRRHSGPQRIRRLPQSSPVQEENVPDSFFFYLSNSMKFDSDATAKLCLE